MERYALLWLLSALVLLGLAAWRGGLEVISDASASLPAERAVRRRVRVHPAPTAALLTGRFGTDDQTKVLAQRSALLEERLGGSRLEAKGTPSRARIARSSPASTTTTSKPTAGSSSSGYDRPPMSSLRERMPRNRADVDLALTPKCSGPAARLPWPVATSRQPSVLHRSDRSDRRLLGHDVARQAGLAERAGPLGDTGDAVRGSARASNRDRHESRRLVVVLRTAVRPDRPRPRRYGRRRADARHVAPTRRVPDRQLDRSRASVARVQAVAQETSGPVMVILDSDHRRSHVAAELELYAPLVTLGSYVLVQDGSTDTLGSSAAAARVRCRRSTRSWRATPRSRSTGLAASASRSPTIPMDG